jgi:hypothetical protein
MSFETYWLLVPSVGAVVLFIACLGLWWIGRPKKHQVTADFVFHMATDAADSAPSSKTNKTP